MKKKQQFDTFEEMKATDEVRPPLTKKEREKHWEELTEFHNKLQGIRKKSRKIFNI